MAKVKISDFSSTAGNNTEIDNINISEGCAPSGINNAIRELMAQLKDFQTGAAGDSFNGPVGTTTAAAGAFTNLTASGTLGVTGVATLTAQPILSSLTASRAVFTDGSKGLVSNAITGTGNVVMSTSPTLVTPNLGTPSTLVGTNITGTASGLSIGGTAAVSTTATSTVSSTASAFKVPFLNTTGIATGNFGILHDTEATFTYNPSTNTLAVGTVSGALSGNATTATTLQTARTINGVSFNGSANITVTANTTNTLTRGTYLTGSNFDGSAATTWAVDATTTNTASKVVARDASGNFAAGTITAALSGNATTATTLQTARTINGTSFNGSADITTANWGTARTLWGQSVNGSANITAPLLPAAGSAAAPAFSTSGDTNTGIYFPAADTIGFVEGGAEVMRLDSSGNLGLGVTPSAWGGTGVKAIDIGTRSAIYSGGAGQPLIAYNFYYNGTNNIYKASSYASAYQQNDGQHQWFTAPSGTAGNAISFTQAMTLDASGNLGVGRTNPSGRLHVQTAAGTDAAFYLQTGDTTTNSSINFGDTGDSSIGWLDYDHNGDYLAIGTNNAERARIDSSGTLLVGTTSTAPSTGGFAIKYNGGVSFIDTSHSSGTGSGQYYAAYTYAGTVVGTITQNGTTGVLYNLTSDYRLKNNAVALTGAKSFVMALQPKTWDWWDGSGKGVGFIAHEFMEVAKYSGNGEKDAVDADGKPVYQSIQPSSSEVMANLVALIQEQQNTIDQLKARLDAANL